MPRSMLRPSDTLRRLWRTDKPLTAVGLAMLVVLAAALVGLWADPRLVTGVPVWLKPAKFAISIAIYTLTLAWVFTFLPEWTRTRRSVSRVTAVVMVVEMAIIAGQAWRGTTSHFNFSTPADAALFSVMGLAIVTQTLVSIAVAVALWRQRFADPALGWALRLGMVITIVGGLSGGLMTRPAAAQLELARTGAPMTTIGAHTVGAPDGGPGLPGTGWSTEHGDLRVPHFIGLHALQALPLFVLAIRRRWTDATRTRLAVVAAGGYVSLFALLEWQALRGQALMQPDSLTVTAAILWAVVTSAAAWMAISRPATAPTLVAV